MDRGRADYMGMLGTVMNCLALQDFLEKAGRRDAGPDRDHDGSGRGALHPASRDPAPREGPGRDLRRRARGAVLLDRHLRRAAGAGDRRRGAADGQGRRRRVRRRPPDQPERDAGSTGSATPRCSRAGCKVADATAFTLCMDNDLPIVVFDLLVDGNIGRAVRGETIGTLVVERQRRRAGARVIDETLFEAEEKMEKAVAVLRDDLATIRTGRATPQMFAKIVVDYYGAPTPMNQLASFTVPEPRMAIISPYDKGSLGAIEKAIRDSDLGVNPTSDGNIIRVVFPQLTEERRRELIKVARRPRPRTAGSRSATSAATPRRRSTSSPRTARPARTRSTGPRRSSRRRRIATSSRSTRRCGPRNPNCSKSDVVDEVIDLSERPDARAEPGPAGPGATCRSRSPSASRWARSCSATLYTCKPVFLGVVVLAIVVGMYELRGRWPSRTSTRRSSRCALGCRRDPRARRTRSVATR